MLRNVNKGLEKKLQAKEDETIILTQTQALPNEQLCMFSDQRVAELELALKTCSSQFEELNQKFQNCATKLAKEEKKNFELKTIKNDISEQLRRVKKQNRELLQENHRIKIQYDKKNGNLGA